MEFCLWYNDGRSLISVKQSLPVMSAQTLTASKKDRLAVCVQVAALVPKSLLDCKMSGVMYC